MSVPGWFVVGVGVAAVSFGVGAAMAATGVVDPVDDHHDLTVGAGEVAYYVCPDDAVAGSFHQGDRVYATGRTEAGDWVAVRAPLDVNARVWVRVDGIEPDRSLDQLPVAACEPLGAAGQASTTTTTAPSESTTSSETSSTETTASTSTSVAPETSTAPLTTPPSTIAPTTAPTTPPPDTQGPVIGAVTSDQPKIWESGCAIVTAEITVPVSDPSGVGRVQLGWSVTRFYGVVDMTSSNGVWVATIGPFTDVLTTYEEPISISVTAWDQVGNLSMRDAGPVLMLGDCD